MAGTWRYFDPRAMNSAHRVNWFVEGPLWPFLRSIQSDQPPKIAGDDALPAVIDAYRLGKRIAFTSPQAFIPRAYAGNILRSEITGEPVWHDLDQTSEARRASGGRGDRR